MFCRFSIKWKCLLRLLTIECIYCIHLYTCTYVLRVNKNMWIKYGVVLNCNQKLNLLIYGSQLTGNNGVSNCVVNRYNINTIIRCSLTWIFFFLDFFVVVRISPTIYPTNTGRSIASRVQDKNYLYRWYPENSVETRFVSGCGTYYCRYTNW